MIASCSMFSGHVLCAYLSPLGCLSMIFIQHIFRSVLVLLSTDGTTWKLELESVRLVSYLCNKDNGIVTRNQAHNPA